MSSSNKEKGSLYVTSYFLLSPLSRWKVCSRIFLIHLVYTVAVGIINNLSESIARSRCLFEDRITAQFEESIIQET